MPLNDREEKLFNEIADSLRPELSFGKGRWKVAALIALLPLSLFLLLVAVSTEVVFLGILAFVIALFAVAKLLKYAKSFEYINFNNYR
ncbi:MAG: hypothetical protein ACKOW9_00145 [Candidatus Paceibacterota bacterium]